MLSIIDYLVIGAITNCSNDDERDESASHQELSNFERNIFSIKRELRHNFHKHFEAPALALELAGNFANGLDEQQITEAKEKASKFKTYSLCIMAKELIDCQPMPFDELKPYLNMVNPHYFKVLDFILWNTMTGSEDLTPAQKALMKNWRNYQKERLNFD